MQFDIGTDPNYLSTKAISTNKFHVILELVNGDDERIDRWWLILANDIDRKPKANLFTPLFASI